MPGQKKYISWNKYGKNNIYYQKVLKNTLGGKEGEKVK